MPEPKKFNRKAVKLAAIALIVVIIALLAWQGLLWRSGKGYLSLIGYEKYQAVFLDNNQVYFGKLYKSGSDYPVLRDIYYLRVNTALQPQNPNTAPDINLVKLGTELHGPEDEMKINKSHILFIEDLKADSQVMKAITDFQAYQQKQAQAK